MEAQVHQATIGMIVDPDIGGATGGTTDNKPTIEHVYGMVSPGNVSSGSSSGLTNVSQSPGCSVRGRSRVWSEFTVTPDGKKVTCHRCGDFLSYSNSHSTSSMLKHLKRKHSLDLYPPPGNEEATEANTQSLVINDNRFKASQVNQGPVDKRMRTGLRKIVPKDNQDVDRSIQHGPLLFKDPCVRMKWTDHSDTFLRSFLSLYSDQSYTDATIVVEKQFFKVHRVILSSASEFFDETFKMTPPSQHPVIFLKDTKAIELRILLDFIYKGEVSIPPNMIPGLVKVGSELRVRGLSDFVWNDQLASSVNMKQQQQTTFPTTQSSSSIPFQKIQSQQNVANTSLEQPKSIKGQVLFRQQPQMPPGQNTQSARTYSRLVNIRPVNNLTGSADDSSPVISPASFQGRIISSEVGPGCSVVGSSSSFQNMKRIRIVTNESRVTPQIRGTGNILPIPTNSSSGGSETVLMVTNEGGTVLSTSQGGVTILSNPASSALSLGNAFDPDQNQNEIEQDHHQSRPVITSITSHAGQIAGQNQITQESYNLQGSQESAEVVYSIDNVSEDAPECNDDQVLLENEEEMACEHSTNDSIDKKPFITQ